VFIINQIAGTYDQPFRPGGIDAQRATDFACGRMFVGQQCEIHTADGWREPAVRHSA
jgi:hypothetical protein